MEFKFRSIEERSTTYLSPPRNFEQRPLTNFSLPSNFNERSHVPYFTQQAIQAGLPSTSLRPRELTQNSNDSRNSIQWELEKERIRARIIAEEVVRRRMIEEEVRRELILEREMSMRTADRYLLGSPVATRFDTRLPLPSSSNNFESRGNFGMGGLLPPHSHREVGFRGFEPLPFQRDPMVANARPLNSCMSLQEIKAPVPEANEDNVVILAKPIINAADLKRKATTVSSEAAVEASSSLSKKPKTKDDDWSCALCQISATSERGLTEHMKGKKHKARENGLVSHKVGFATGPLPTKSVVEKPIKVLRIPKAPSFRKGKDEKAEGGQTSSGKADITLLPKIETSIGKKKNRGKTKIQKTTAGGKPLKKFRFWCEMCQVGAYSEDVMNAHNKGKKHLANLSASGKTSAEKVVVKETKHDMVAEEVKHETERNQVEAKDNQSVGDLL